MAPPADERCKECKWFEAVVGKTKGYCHAAPPETHNIEDDRPGWRVTSPDGWCGEWKKE